MSELAQKHLDQLDRIKNNSERAQQYWERNAERFNKGKKFAFYSTITETERVVLDEIGQPKIECNLIEAFISRLCGEFSKQEPSIKVGSEVEMPGQADLIRVVEGHFRHAEYEARMRGVANEIFKDLAGGGYSVIKLYTEYKNSMSFDQDIKWKRVFDPTLCGFDPLAQESDKSDGDFCFELFPKTKEEFEEMYPDVDLNKIAFGASTAGFKWSYTNLKDKILLLCDYYEKKKKKIKIVRLANNETMTKDKYNRHIEAWEAAGMIEQPPAIVEERTTEKITICRYRFIENQVLEYEETDYPGLPLIFADCNSVLVQDSEGGSVNQVIRSYAYNAVGAQKVANIALQSIANEMSNSIQHKFIIAQEAIPEEYVKAYTDVQVPMVVVYKAFLDKEGVNPGDVALPPPREVQRPPMPPEFLQTLQLSFQLIQNILGSFDASLGINNNQLSSLAIIEGATQSNNAAMPMVIGYMRAMNRLSQLYLDMLPKYWVTPRTMPIMLPDGRKEAVKINQAGGMKLDYDEGILNVKVEAGVNFEIQKSRALKMLAQVGQSFPIFAQFMGQKGLNVIIDNMDLRSIDQLKELSKQFEQEMQKQQQQAQQMQQQQMQTNPQLINAKTQQQKLMLDAQQNQVENKLKVAELSVTQQQADNDRIKILAEMQQNERDNLVEMDKHETEKTRAAVDMAISAADMSHRHAKDHHELLMKREMHNKQMRETNND